MSIEGGNDRENLVIFIDPKITDKIRAFMQFSGHGRKISFIVRRCMEEGDSIGFDEIPKEMRAYYLAYAYFAAYKGGGSDLRKRFQTVNEFGNQCVAGMEGFFANYLVGVMTGEACFDSNEYTKCYDEFQEGVHRETVDDLIRKSTVAQASADIRVLLGKQLGSSLLDDFLLNLITCSEADLDFIADVFNVDEPASKAASACYGPRVSPQQNPLAYLQYFEPLLREYLLISLFQKRIGSDMDQAIVVDSSTMLGNVDEALRTLKLNDILHDEESALGTVRRTQLYRELIDEIQFRQS